MLAVVSGAQDSHKFMSGIIAGIMIARRSTVAVPIGSFGGRVSLLHVPATADRGRDHDNYTRFSSWSTRVASDSERQQLIGSTGHDSRNAD